MPNTNLQKDAMNAMVIMNAAITNIRLYPPSSALISNSVDKAHSAIQAILEKKDSLVFAEAEKNLLISGQPLSEKDQQQPQVIAFLELLLNFGVKTISFEKGLERAELISFLEIANKKPEDVEKEGGLQETLKKQKLPHITLDQKVYVAMDKDQQILAGLNIKDQEIVKYLMGDSTASDIDTEKIREMATNPEWITQVFQTGLKNIKKGAKGDNLTSQLSHTFGQMIHSLGNIAGSEDKEQIFQNIAGSLSNMDDEALCTILTQNIDDMLGDGLFDNLVNQLDDNRFELLASKIKGMSNKPVTGDGSANELLNSTYENMMRSDKGKRLEKSIKEKVGREKKLKEKHVAHLKTGVSSILKGEKDVFEDRQVMQSLPNTVCRLFAKNKTRTAEAMIDRLGDAILSEKPDGRAEAAEILSQIVEKLASQQRLNEMPSISSRLTGWIQFENRVTPVYEKICIQLQNLAQTSILDHRFAESDHILKTFNQILSGEIKKNEKIQNIAGDVLKQIATDDILDLLLKEFHTNEKNMRDNAVNTLVLLGTHSVGRLLDILRESQDMSERIRTVGAVSKMGPSISPALTEQIKQGGPWYYLRNLVVLLGKAGTEDDLNTLQPLLTSDDFRVQREVLNSIYNIGGKYRGEIFLSSLPSADNRMKINIISMLGALKYGKALRPLLELLNSGSIVSSKEKDPIQEKICTALGHIASKEAIPALEAIAQQKSLLKTKSHKKVQDAAESALKMINKGPVREDETKPSVIKDTTPSTEPALKKAKNKTTEEDELKKHLKSVDELVGKNDKEAAVKLLFDLIVKCAREKNFTQAEVLREKLYEVDSMALTEIVKSGEIIEEEKSESIDQDHLNIWPELYDTLTKEEANALYYAMEEAVYGANEIIIKQGELNSNLYFIMQGEVKIVYRQDDREMLLTMLGAGNIAGEDTFFSITVCTTSMMSLTQVKLTFLEKNILSKWKDEFPALESKLHNYCLSLEKTHDLLKKKGMDRRAQKRVKISGRVTLQLLNVSQKLLGKPFRGDLSDISVGGLSLFIITSKKETASLLLGRNLNVKFIIPGSEPRQKVDQNAAVIGVHYHLNNEYSMHMKFERKLSDKIIEDVENSAGSQA